MKVESIFECFERANPAPATELIYHSPFELLIAVILSAQATDKRVNQVTQHLFSVANTPQQVFALGENGLKEYIQSVNFYLTKARNIIKTCRILVDCYQNQVPSDRHSLEALPGVGRKTASVVLNVAFNQVTMPVDTHIFRVCNRTGLAPGKTPSEVEQGLIKVVPQQYQKRAHHWLVLHGRYTCKARIPACKICIIGQFCQFNHRP